MTKYDISQHAKQGGHALRGRPQAEDHVQRRIAATMAKVASVPVSCKECGADYNRTSPSQKYCSGQCYNRVARRRRDADPARKHYSTKESKTAYRVLVERDGEVCRICGVGAYPENSGRGKGRLAVDHDHTTKQIRGLLCHGCNTALGLFKDNVDLLKSAIHYLNP